MLWQVSAKQADVNTDAMTSFCQTSRREHWCYGKFLPNKQTWTLMLWQVSAKQADVNTDAMASFCQTSRREHWCYDKFLPNKQTWTLMLWQVSAKQADVNTDAMASFCQTSRREHWCYGKFLPNKQTWTLMLWQVSAKQADMDIDRIMMYNVQVPLSAFRYPFHPCVTAVARKRPQSSCQKRRWQVTAKHAYTLRMWLCTKWHGAWLYGVHRTRRDWLSGSRFLWHQPCQCCKYTTSVDIQKHAIKTIH